MLVYELSGCGFKSSYSHLNFPFHACFNPRVLGDPHNYRVLDSFWNTYVTWQEHTVKMDRTDNYTQHSSIISPILLNGCVFLYELIGCGFQFSSSHLNFRFRTLFEQGVPLHSDNYIVWIQSETRTWYDKNIQSKWTAQISTQNTAQSFGQYGYMVECSFTN